jgi:hypothetical protein
MSFRGYPDVTGVIDNATWGLTEARLQVRILLSQNYPSVRENILYIEKCIE